MKILSDRNITIYMFGAQSVGKTLGLTAYYANPVIAKDGQAHISIDFEKTISESVLKKQKESIINNRSRYVGTQRPEAYSAVLNYKDCHNIAHQPLASVKFIDVPGGVYDELQKSRDYNLDAFNLDLNSNPNSYKAFILLINAYSFLSCGSYPFKCGKIKGERCQHFCSKIGKKSQSSYDCTYFNRDYAQNFIYQALRLATKNNCHFQIVVNHCDDFGIFNTTKERDEVIKEIKETINVWLNEAPFTYDASVRPNIYFIDSFSAIENSGSKRWKIAQSLPLLDILYSFLERQDMRYSEERRGKAGFFKHLRYAWHKFLFDSPVLMRDRCRDLIRQQLNLYGDGGGIN